MKKEIFNGLYVIYSDGRIWSNIRNKFLKGRPNKDGYLRVAIFKIEYFIHRLVAEAFIPNPNNLPYVNHINHNITDNSINNLEWCTHRENCQKRIKKSKIGLNINFDKRHNRYYTRIYHNKQFIYLGCFKTFEEAGKVRDEYIRLHNL